MRIRLHQISRDLFDASFAILTDSGYSVGSIGVRGRLGTPESKISITLLKDISSIGNGRLYESKISLHRKFRANTKGKDAYRPYEITRGEEKCGEIFQATQKTSLFKSYGYQYMILNDTEYSMFPIGFGDEGTKNPVYIGNEQIALVKKESIIVDDLHDFEIIVKDESYLMAVIIMCGYIYAKAFFKPGQLMKKGIYKLITTTTEQELLDKYDSSFEATYGGQ